MSGTGWRLDRRTFLRGTGASLALPWLDAMLPTQAMAEGVAAGAAAAVPQRLAFIFFPIGAIMPDWKPAGDSGPLNLTRTLAPLAPVKSRINVLTGLAHDKARPHGNGAGDHARSAATFLTASIARKTGGADIHVGTSVDQIAAAKVGHKTRLPSFEIGVDPVRQGNNCDSGYACAYQSNISWRSPNQPLAKEVVPELAFERLFGKRHDPLRKFGRRDVYRRSVLDAVLADAAQLEQKLGQSDRQKLDEYFTSVREVEQRVDVASRQSQDIPELELPAGMPAEYTAHIPLMYDILALAFQTDATRIATFMLANEGSNRVYSHVNVRGGHHELSHHRGDEERIAAIQRIDEYLVTEFARFLGRLQAMPEGEGTVLDNSLIVYGSAISDGNRHQHHDLPIVLAGRGGGAIETDRHLVYPEETPLANLFVGLLDHVGAPVDSFGDSTGKLVL